MAVLASWVPPSREHWELIVLIFQCFPIVTLFQWIQLFDWSFTWYPTGKTSRDSRFNIPGKIAWASMESPGYLVMLYTMYSLPKHVGIAALPWGNWVMAGMFTVHYIYRSIIFAYLSPSISPMHPFPWISAGMFNILNGLSLGGWLGGFGPTKDTDWYGSALRLELGMMIWAIGFMANMWHDDELREIRRAAARNQKRREEEKGDDEKKGDKGVEKIYMMPENGLFSVVLYPHYFTEWIEWAGFCIVGGWTCVPAMTFLMNEIATMLPRAIQGKQWYVKKFGKEKVGARKAVIPGLI